MVVGQHIADQVIGLLTQDESLIAQVRTLLPDIQIFASKQKITRASLDILLIDDAINDFREALKRTTSHHIPIILIIDLESEELNSALDISMIDYVPKPLSTQLLSHRLNQMLRLSGLSSFDEEKSVNQIGTSPTNKTSDYQRILEGITDPVFVFDSEGTYLRIPPVQTTNYLESPDKMLGKRIHDQFQPDIADLFVANIQQALQSQSAQILEYELPLENRRAFFSAVINPIAGRDEVVWIARDITHAKLNEIALRETEKRYRQLFENANDMILTTDLETGRILDANKQAQKQLGYSRRELLDLNIKDIEEPLEDVQSRIKNQVLATSGHIIIEQTYRGKDGKLIPVEISTRITEYRLRPVLLSFARNITKRKRAMNAEAEQRSFAEALRESVSQLARALTMSDVLDTMITTATKVVHSDNINIMLVEGDTAQIIRAHGYRGLFGLLEVVHIPEIFTINHMHQTQQAIVISDVESDHRWRHVGDENWLKSYVGAPLVINNLTIGFINLDSQTTNYFTNKHRQRLQAFADQAAIAIHKARLYEAEREQRIIAEALQDSIKALNNTLNIDDVLDAVLGAMKLTVEHDAANIMLIEDETLNIVRQQGYPNPLPNKIPLDSIDDLPIVYNSQKPIVINDTQDYQMWDGDNRVHGEVHWVRSNVKIPIIYNQEVIGLLLLDSSEPNTFTTEDVDLLQTFADQASIAIQNARLYEAEREQRIFSETLQNSIKTLNETLNIDDVLDAILDAIQANVEHEAANIMLIENDTLLTVRQRGYKHGVPETIPLHKIKDFLLVQETKQPFIIKDTHQHDGWMGLGDVAWVRCNIKVPIVYDNEVIGIINLDSSEPNKYTFDDAELMQTFADQASLAIQNARLYEAEREQRMFAETLRDTAITLNQQLNIDELFETIITAVEQVIKIHDTASIITINPDKATGIVVTDHGFENFGGSVKGLQLDLKDSKVKQRLLEQRKPILISDTHASDLWIHVDETIWIRSHMSVPIYIQRNILALINLDSQHPNKFTQDHIERLVAFSHQVAIALQNAQLVEQIQGYTHELESRVQQRTAEVEKERALLQLERSQLRAILDAMRDGVYYTDNNYAPVYINNALSEMTGYTTDDWLSSRVFKQINQVSEVDRDKLWKAVETHLDTHHFWYSESQLTRADGTEFDASLTRTEVRGIDNERVGIVTVVRDISLQRQLEEQKSRFIAFAAHELRTPITNIKTRLFLMRHQPERLNEHLAIVESTSNWMQTLVDNLFDQSRFERGIIELNLEDVVLQDLIQTVVKTQQAEASKKNIIINTDWQDRTISMQGDKSRLRQVITNLVNNAINYTPADGEITVKLYQDQHDKHTAVIIKIMDTGIGIDEMHIPHLFQPFYRATDDRKGAGLGLSIAREIVEAHDGSIAVQSKIDHGTTFTITLPILKAVKVLEGSR